MKKILHLLDTINYSGAEVMLNDSYDYFLHKNYSQYVLSKGKTLGPYASTLQNKGFRITQIPIRKSFSYFIEIYKYFKINKFDIVQIHASHAYFWNAVTIKLANPKTKIFRTYHDVFHECSNYRLLISIIQYYLCRKILGVKGISIGDSVEFIENNVFKNPTVIVNNWIDESNFRPPSNLEIQQSRKELNISQTSFVILTVGTCNAKKCHSDIFHSIKNLSEQIPDLVFLHRGTGEDLEKEKNLVKNLGIEKNVIFLGYIEHLPKIYWAADCFILASKREGLGDVIIEAIATKLPVILYNGWGMKDFKPKSEKDTYGFWINPSSESFDHAILDIYNKKKNNLLFEWKENAYLFFKSKFSRAKSLDKLAEMYNRL